MLPDIISTLIPLFSTQDTELPNYITLCKWFFAASFLVAL